MPKIFFNVSHTSLGVNSTPISVGIITSSGEHLYAEYIDFDYTELDDIASTYTLPEMTWWGAYRKMGRSFSQFFKTVQNDTIIAGKHVYAIGDRAYVNEQIRIWYRKHLRRQENVEVWGDQDARGTTLLQSLFQPIYESYKNVSPDIYDLSTVFKVYGIDPKMSREAFINRPLEFGKYEALYQARVIEACYDKLAGNGDFYLNRGARK